MEACYFSHIIVFPILIICLAHIHFLSLHNFYFIMGAFGYGFAVPTALNLHNGIRSLEVIFFHSVFSLFHFSKKFSFKCASYLKIVKNLMKLSRELITLFMFIENILIVYHLKDVKYYLFFNYCLS